MKKNKQYNYIFITFQFWKYFNNISNESKTSQNKITFKNYFRICQPIQHNKSIYSRYINPKNSIKNLI